MATAGIWERDRKSDFLVILGVWNGIPHAEVMMQLLQHQNRCEVVDDVKNLRTITSAEKEVMTINKN